MEQKIKWGSPHTHDESMKDSSCGAENIVRKMFEYGSPAVYFSDHGSLTGFELQRIAVEKYQEVIKSCKSKNCKACPLGKQCNEDFNKCASKQYAQHYIDANSTIKLILGVEAYFEDEALFVKRAHLLLHAKDNIGLEAIFQAVTESNENLDSQGFPRMNFSILEKWFGKGSMGHGHVVASSACMVGIMSSVLLANTYIEEDIKKARKKMAPLNSPDSSDYSKSKGEQDHLLKEIKALTERNKTLQSISKRPFAKKEKAVNAAIGTSDYETLLNLLNKEKAETEAAKTEIESNKVQISKYKAEEKKLREFCTMQEKDHEKYRKFDSEIKRLESSMSSDEELYKQAKKQAHMFDEIFGHGNFFAEVQYHGINEEAKAMPIIAQIAREMDLPLLATNDAHMVSNSPEELKKRQIIRSMRFNQWEEMRDSDKELYLKTDKELSEALLKILPEDIVEDAMLGIKTMTEMCNIEFTYQSHYPVFPSINGEISQDRLRRLAIEGIAWRYPDEKLWTKEHQERLEYELSVISKLGFDDYLCIVQDFLEYGRLLGQIDLSDPRYLADPFNISLLKSIRKEHPVPGIGIGPGRGSAVGSLVCYLIGITGIDPMKYGLIFERFLNVERVSMPDIDSDIRSDIRDNVLDYVKHKYGNGAVCCIMNRGTQKAKAAIRNCARLYGSEKHDNSLYYKDLGDAIAKAIPSEIGITLSECEKELRDTFKTNKAAQDIIDNAKLVEGTFVTVGMHAAGVIIADNGNVSKYVPLMYISGKGEFATQCDKDMCEGRGLLKMDFLGLKNLCIITDALKMIQKNHGISIDIESVPFEMDVFNHIYSEGNTNSVFQFESSGMKQMLRQFQPNSIEDIILLVAAYRPGPMQYLDSVIAVKHKRKKPEYVISEMETILGKTYGSPIYQEQIMEIFNKFAGFTLGEADIIRRYMSKKKTEKFAAYKDKFIDGLVKRGAKKDKAEEFWIQLVEFSKYAFNRSHAAAYAFVSYYTAWLKEKYPHEYLTAVINYSKFEKLGNLIGDANGFNIAVKQPDINMSDNDFSVKDETIICGLGNIKGIGQSATVLLNEREENGPFKSFQDFLLRTKAGEGVVATLINAGAFDTFCRSREALLEALPFYSNLVKKIKEKEKVIADEVTESSDENVIAKEMAKKERAKKALQDRLKELEDVFVDEGRLDNHMERLQKEKELVGAYVSAHPMDTYDKPEDMGCIPIAKLTTKKFVKIAGVVCDLRIAKRKSDGANMAFFRLEDKSGSIDVCCFTQAYKDAKDLLVEDGVLQLSGECKEESTFSSNDEEEDDMVLKFYMNNAEPLEEKKVSIRLHIKSYAEWVDKITDLVKPYRVPNGIPLLVYIEDLGLIRETTFTVSPEILDNRKGIQVKLNT